MSSYEFWLTMRSMTLTARVIGTPAIISGFFSLGGGLGSSFFFGGGSPASAASSASFSLCFCFFIMSLWIATRS